MASSQRSAQALPTAERDALLEHLESANEEVRRLAVEQLLTLPAAESVPALTERLGDAAWRVRKAAIERIVACRDDALVQSGLLRALADGENPGRRNAAFEALVLLGVRVTKALVEAVSSPDVDVRKLAIDAMAAIADPSTRDVLIAALDDVDANVRAAAADALGGVGGVTAVGRLLRSATQPTEVPLVRLAALRSLERLEASVGVDSLAEALAHPQLRPAALELLGHSTDPSALVVLEKGLASGARSIRESAICALLRQLARQDGAEADALCARIRTLGQSDEMLVTRCCDGLEGEDLGRRIVLVQFLGLVADERAVLPMLQAGRDEALREPVDATLETLGSITVTALRRVWGVLGIDLEMRACAILGTIGGAGAEELLVTTLASSRSPAAVRAALALAEGAYARRLPELVARLEAAVRETESERADEVELLMDAVVRLSERSAASGMDVHVQLVEVLASRLGGAPEAMRVAVARVLGRVGRARDADLIEYLSRDASPLVRRAAVEALVRLDGERMRSALRRALGDESSRVRIAAAGVRAGQGSREALDDLERLADDRDPRVAAAALRAAGAVLSRGGEAAQQECGWLVGAVGREPLVALAALDSFTKIGGALAVRTAVDALVHPESEVVRAAIACLARHGEGDSLTPLVALVTHPDWPVRAEAVEVLSARRVRRALPALLRRLECEDDAFVRDAVLMAARRLEE